MSQKIPNFFACIVYINIYIKIVFSSRIHRKVKYLDKIHKKTRLILSKAHLLTINTEKRALYKGCYGNKSTEVDTYDCKTEKSINHDKRLECKHL